LTAQENGCEASARLILGREADRICNLLMKDFCHKGIVLEPSDLRWAFLFPGSRKPVPWHSFSVNPSGILAGFLSGNYSVKGNTR
jgi:hypothetical protein